MAFNPDVPEEMRYITRVDLEEGNNDTHGWQVRVRRKSLKIREFFNDINFGGKDESLNAAKTFRDAIVKEHDLTWGEQKNFPLHSNKDGNVGVHRTTGTSHKPYGTYKYEYWVAHWPGPNGKTKTTKFSISKYGEEEALRLALEARKKGVEKRKKRLENLQQKKQSIFTSPDNTEIKIWRYMDFTKFVSMLENEGLFFPRSDFLGDPFEGSFSKVNQEFRPLVYKTKPEEIDQNYISEFIQELQKYILISCWHMNELESAAMWDIYAKTNEAICIQSRFSKLQNLLEDSASIGKVNYINYEKEWVPETHPLYPFLHKRKSFEHEREVRAVINLAEVETFDELDPSVEPPKNGRWKNLPLNELIETVYVAPQAQEWFFDLVKSVVNSYSLEVPVKKSILEESPIY